MRLEPKLAPWARSSRLRFGAALLIGTLTSLRCAGSDSMGPDDRSNDPNPVSRVTLIPSTATLRSLGEMIQVSATALDVNGNEVPGIVVGWSSSDRRVLTTSATGQITAVSNGLATLTATVRGVSGSAEITVEQMPAQLTYRVQPTAVIPSELITPQIEVAILDALGHVVADANDAVSMTIGDNPNNGSLLGTVTVTAANGVARFEDLSLDRSGNGYTLMARLGTLPATTSASFNVRFTFTMVSAGLSHSCGVTTNETAYCWGANEPSLPVDDGGRLGNGTLTNSSQPVRVVGGVAWARIDVDAFHSCGITGGGGTGQAYCWGSNTFGQLGTGSNVSSASPVAVTGPLFLAIESGSRHSCGLALLAHNGFFGPVHIEGRIYCWGSGYANSPALVGNFDVRRMSAGNGYVCVVTAASDGACWGSNSFGKLGIGNDVQSVNAPTTVVGLLKFQSLTTGSSHTCGVSLDGDAYCWGRNIEGQLGDGTTQDTNSPVPVAGGLKFIAISPAANHTCGITTNSITYCWGANDEGQLGTGTTALSLTPVPVTGGLEFISVSTRSLHTCGVTTDGLVYCWGDNANGALGIGTATFSAVPVQVSDPA